MLVNLKEILEIAEKENKAVGAFNVTSFEFAQSIIDAAEEMNTPIIIQHAPAHLEYLSMEDAGHMLCYLAKKAKVPVCVHLDHGDSIEYCLKGIEIGYSSIMYDGSLLPFEKNIENTKYITDLAHKKGITVEAEIGSIPNNVKGDLKEYTPEDFYTDPLVAKEFVEKTNVDCLAISFGTVHGIYKAKPKLSIGIIEKARESTEKLPLVMHGGSGLTDSDYHNAINAGIRKINFYTYSSKYAGEKVYELVKNNPDGMLYHDIVMCAKAAIKEETKRAIKLFNNKGEL